MGKLFSEIDERNAAFIRAQQMFFVATAPSGGEGHVNLSPKGLDSFAILDGTTVAYLDFVGSGVETAAHLRDNGRIVIMFCAFEGPPRIFRLHGRGEAIEPADAAWAELSAQFPPADGARCIIRVQVERISDSCGYGVPLYRFEGERDQLPKWVERKGADGIERYKAENNAVSIDGLPGLRNT